jgi:hypothetical protein
MSIADLLPVTTSRDWNDVIKFPGRFTTVRYEDAIAPLDTIHRIQIAPVAAPAGGAPLDPMTHLIVIKNMSKTDQVEFNFATLADGNQVQATIEPEQMVAFPDLDPAIVPQLIRSLGTNPCECEIFEIGWYTSPDPQ